MPYRISNSPLALAMRVKPMADLAVTLLMLRKVCTSTPNQASLEATW